MPRACSSWPGPRHRARVFTRRAGVPDFGPSWCCGPAPRLHGPERSIKQNDCGPTPTPPRSHHTPERGRGADQPRCGWTGVWVAKPPQRVAKQRKNDQSPPGPRFPRTEGTQGFGAPPGTRTPDPLIKSDLVNPALPCVQWVFNYLVPLCATHEHGAAPRVHGMVPNARSHHAPTTPVGGRHAARRAVGAGSGWSGGLPPVQGRGGRRGRRSVGALPRLLRGAPARSRPGVARRAGLSACGTDLVGAFARPRGRCDAHSTTSRFAPRLAA